MSESNERKCCCQQPVKCCNNISAPRLALKSLKKKKRKNVFFQQRGENYIRDSSQYYKQGKKPTKMSKNYTSKKPRVKQHWMKKICEFSFFKMWIKILRSGCVCLCRIFVVKSKGKWMHALMPSMCVCLPCISNTQLIIEITAFSCGSQQGTKGRLKNQECLSSSFSHLVNDEVAFSKNKNIPG